MAGAQEVRMLKNPSLPRAATGNGLRRGLRDQAWLSWAPHLATLSGPTSEKLQVWLSWKQMSQHPLWVLSAPGWCPLPPSQGLALLPRLRDVGPAWGSEPGQTQLGKEQQAMLWASHPRCENQLDYFKAKNVL